MSAFKLRVSLFSGCIGWRLTNESLQKIVGTGPKKVKEISWSFSLFMPTNILFISLWAAPQVSTISRLLAFHYCREYPLRSWNVVPFRVWFFIITLINWSFKCFRKSTFLDSFPLLSWKNLVLITSDLSQLYPVSLQHHAFVFRMHLNTSYCLPFSAFLFTEWSDK